MYSSSSRAGWCWHFCFEPASLFVCFDGFCLGGYGAWFPLLVSRTWRWSQLWRLCCTRPVFRTLSFSLTREGALGIWLVSDTQGCMYNLSGVYSLSLDALFGQHRSSVLHRFPDPVRQDPVLEFAHQFCRLLREREGEDLYISY